MTTANKYAPTAWGKEQFLDLEVPSGQLCQVRMPGIEQLIAIGILDNVDTLMAVIDEKHIKRVKGRTTPARPRVGDGGPRIEVDTASILRDPAALVKMFTMIDKITCHMVVQPSVKRPIKIVDDKEIDLLPEEREEGQVYTDQVAVQDRMFIFQYTVGGDTDLESFRKQFNENLGSVAVS